MPTPLSVSDYFVLDGLKIGNSWAQNRLARLNLEQRQKEQADEIYQKNQDRQQRANESYYDREFRSEEGNLNRQQQERIESERTNREDLRQQSYLDRVLAQQEAMDRRNRRDARMKEKEILMKSTADREKFEREEILKRDLARQRSTAGIPADEKMALELYKAATPEERATLWEIVEFNGQPVPRLKKAPPVPQGKGPGATFVPRDPKTGKFPIPIK